MKHYITKESTSRQWLFTASIDGVSVDYEEILESDTEPDFWTLYTIAEDHGCSFFQVEELTPEYIGEEATA